MVNSMEAEGSLTKTKSHDEGSFFRRTSSLILKMVYTEAWFAFCSFRFACLTYKRALKKNTNYLLLTNQSFNTC